MRIIEAILHSMRSGRAVKLEPFEKSRRPDKDQKIELRPVKAPEVVNAESPFRKGVAHTADGKGYQNIQSGFW